MSSNLINVVTDSARLYKTKLDSDVRTASMNMTQFRSLSRPVANFGKNKGQLVEIEKYGKLSKTSTAINELRSLPVEKPSINFVQVSINEYGKGTTWTKKAEMVSEYAVDEELKELIAINMAESMDGIAGAAYTASDVFYTPTSATAGTLDKDGTVTATSAAALTSAHIRDIVKNMKNDNVPKWDGSNYLAVLHVFTMERLFEDTASGGVMDLKKYDQPEDLIRGEIGQYFGCRFVEENNVFTGTIGGSAVAGDGVFLGFDPVVEALADPEHTEMESHDFGRFNAIAWTALTGFKKVWTNADDGEYRIVYLHSAD